MLQTMVISKWRRTWTPGNCNAIVIVMQTTSLINSFLRLASFTCLIILLSAQLPASILQSWASHYDIVSGQSKLQIGWCRLDELDIRVESAEHASCGGQVWSMIWRLPFAHHCTDKRILVWRVVDHVTQPCVPEQLVRFHSSQQVAPASHVESYLVYLFCNVLTTYQPGSICEGSNSWSL